MMPNFVQRDNVADFTASAATQRNGWSAIE